MAETEFKPTKLLWDNYISYLIFEILNSNFKKRSGNKPMATPRGEIDSHLISREEHEELVANIAKMIAEELGLNANYLYIGMLMHDAGHPFSAHEGEVIFDTIGRIYNTGYFHHNAKGVEVILSEDICCKAIDRIQGIENNPDLRKKLEDEFYRFLDIVISHDGEATKSDADKEVIEYSSIKEAVLTKLKLANATNNYKFIAQDIEGRLGKVADVLAYLATDIQDGFRLGIIKDFNDEYLEAFGTMFLEIKDLTTDEDCLNNFGKEFFEKGNFTGNEKIAFATFIINKIKMDKIKDLKHDMNLQDNKRIMQYVDNTLKKARKIAQEKDLRIIDVLTDEFIQSEISIIEGDADKADLDEGKKQKLFSDINKYKEFIGKMLTVSTGVAERVTNIMQDYFIKDIIANSKDTGRISFSKKAEDIFYKMKALNYEYIVQHTRWDYQREAQPEAARRLVEFCKSGLIKSGTIRDMFYDESIRCAITDTKALGHMRTEIRKESSYTEYKKEIRMPTIPTDIHIYTETEPGKLTENVLLRNIIDYTREKGRIFAIKYMNVFEAIPNTVKENVECALKDEIKCKDYLQEIQRESNSKIRERMIKEYGSVEEAEKHKEEFIEILIAEERSNMEEKMAIQLAIDYLSGMTDRSFNDLAIKMGFMTRDQITNAKRGGSSSNVIHHLNALKAEEDTVEGNNGETKKKRSVGPDDQDAPDGQDGQDTPNGQGGPGER